MSNLLNTAEGRNVVLEAQRHLLRRRLSRFFKRNLVIDYEQYSKGLAEFDLGTLLGQLNVAWDDELIDLYRLLGTIGALPESIADTQIYVNPTTGSDITGTGSTDRPYASLWFLGFLPKRINHLYRVLIYGDIDHGGPLTLTNEFGDGGSLSFVGVGPAVEVFSAVASDVTQVRNFQSVWLCIDTTIAPVPGVTKSFIQFTSGTNDNDAAPVCQINAASNLVFFRRDALSSVGVADTFRYIEPAQKLTLQGFHLDCRGSSGVSNATNWRGSRVNFVNLTISIDYSGVAVGPMVTIKGVPVSFPFCQLEVGGQPSIFPVEIYNSVNEYNPLDDQLSALSQCGVDNLFLGTAGQPLACGMQFINPDDNEYDFDSRVLKFCNGAAAHDIDCMSETRVTGSVLLRRISTKTCVFNCSTVDADNLCFSPNDIDDALAVDMLHSNVYFGQILVGTCSNAIRLLNSRCYFFAGAGDDASGDLTNIANYAIEMAGQSKFYFRNAWTGPSGTVNDLYFSDPAAPVAAAFPAANAIVSGGLGSDCSRYN